MLPCFKRAFLRLPKLLIACGDTFIERASSALDISMRSSA
jgi:hypothetical protein